jgi:D-alanyl-D-alanine carboxypeptidase
MKLRRRSTVLLAGAVCATATLVPAITMGAASADRSDDHAATQAVLDSVRKSQGAVGAGVTVTEPKGSWALSSGTGKLGADQPIKPTDRVRIASNTKMFVTSVVLQLVAEGKMSLDATVEHYLPGVIKGNGYDGTKITVRQLLQHTSGLAEYLTPDLLLNPLNHYRTYTPEQHLASALSRKPAFAPGSAWGYSNTNFIVAGMLIQKVTGRTPAEEITDRIIKPLGLTGTYYPSTGDKFINGAHVRGYAGALGVYLDVTGAEPSMAGAAGALISTGADMTKFVQALADGRVVPSAQLAEMRRTTAVSTNYGLGLFRVSLSCGGVAWGHNGVLSGYHTWALATDDGRSAFMVENIGPPQPVDASQTVKVVDSALCNS